jgi:hypothetical protein
VLGPPNPGGLTDRLPEAGNARENKNREGSLMGPKRNDLTPAQRLAVYDRKRMLEARAPADNVTAEMLTLQCDLDYDPAVSRLPHARPTPPRPAVVAETARRLAQACETAELETRRRRAQLAAIAAGVLPHSANWKRWTSGG